MNVKTGDSRRYQHYTLRYEVGLMSLFTSYTNIPDWEANSYNLISFNGTPIESREKN